MYPIYSGGNYSLSQILPLQKLGGIGQAKYPKYQNRFFSKLLYYCQNFVELPKQTVDSRSIGKDQIPRRC